MLAFFQMFSNALLRRMVLVGPRNLHHTAEGCFDSEPADLWAGGQKYAYRVALSRHFDLDVGFFPIFFG